MKRSFASSPAKGPRRRSVPAAIATESPVDDTASSASPNPTGGGGGGSQHRQGQVMTAPLDLAGEDTLVRDYMLFKKSAAPSRVMYFSGGAWKDFPAGVMEFLREGFAEGKAMVDVPIGDSLFLFDFVRMVRIEVATEARDSIAWIDVNGNCFFPRTFSERSAVRPWLEGEARVDENGGAATSGESVERKSPPWEPCGEHSDGSQVIPAAGGLGRQKWAGVEELDQGNRIYKIVENIFLTGMRKFEPGTTITSIHRCPYADVSGKGRLKAFLTQMEMTKSARGTANVRVGWYGTSASGVHGVISHGLGQPNNTTLGPEAQAVGVYLAPQNSPHRSSSLSEADETGENHVILCRIIMGNIEKVDTCSTQFHPSSDEFDSGVDDLEKPRWYIVWSTHMNTHILPEYIVSFKTLVSGPQAKEASRKIIPGRIALSFPKLLAEIGNSLPSSKMQALETLYDRFKAEKISREIFLKNVRAIAGDKLLSMTLKRYHKSLPASVGCSF